MGWDTAFEPGMNVFQENTFDGRRNEKKRDFIWKKERKWFGASGVDPGG
jgi:hypothetical protein